ncbi:MAG TPA: hypothetical protein VKX17_08955 [Planctomycetota bacterium]|nr:hypothetical protein [Planctomycetota bacterium]
MADTPLQRVKNALGTALSWRHHKVRVICIVLAIAVGAYAVYFTSAYRAFKAQLSAIRGIHLEDSRNEVKYRLGYPPEVLGGLEEGPWGGSQRVFYVFGRDSDKNKMPSTTKVEDYSEWVYEEAGSNVRLTVKFSNAGLVESLKLYSYGGAEVPPPPPGFVPIDAVSGKWGPIAGLYSNDTEEIVLRLGTPTGQRIVGVSKTIEYCDIGIKVTLAKGRAYMIEISAPQDKGAIFWRFLRSHHWTGGRY